MTQIPPTGRYAPRQDERFVCTVCGHGVPIRDMPSTCPACDGILDLVFEDKAENRGLAGEVESPGIWIWQDWLPSCAPENRVTLGEGQTPLLRCQRLRGELGLSSLWVKYDAVMPSGSFKDRALALTALLAGKAGIVLSSSGNAGASAAAYAARAGLAAWVLAPASAPRSKLAQIMAAGARLVPVNGNTSDGAVTRTIARIRLVGKMAHDDLVCPPPVSACDYPARGLALSAFHPQLSRRRGPAR